jgi:hypothetical protein
MLSKLDCFQMWKAITGIPRNYRVHMLITKNADQSEHLLQKLRG